MDIRELICKDTKWNELDQNRIQHWDLVLVTLILCTITRQCVVTNNNIFSDVDSSVSFGYIVYQAKKVKGY